MTGLAATPIDKGCDIEIIVKKEVKDRKIRVCEVEQTGVIIAVDEERNRIRLIFVGEYFSRY